MNEQEAKKELIKILNSSISKNDNIFEYIETHLNDFYNKSCSSMLELKQRTVKQKGFLFEIFAKYYLLAKGYTQVILFNDIAIEQKQQFGFTNQDNGIDLIAIKDNNYFAVQVKYRNETVVNGKLKRRVTWRDISTFLSLATRTGPSGNWTKHFIFTNADSVSWKGHKSKKDYTIARKTLLNQSRIFWISMINIMNNGSNTINKTCVNIESQENIRKKREEWLNKLTTKDINK